MDLGDALEACNPQAQECSAYGGSSSSRRHGEEVAGVDRCTQRLEDGLVEAPGNLHGERIHVLDDPDNVAEFNDIDAENFADGEFFPEMELE
eukprot:5955458-Karenia_brevis.AAC.1